MMYIERKEHFCAAHKLHNPQWTEAENKAAFGKCANKNFHGHNYALTVTIKGPIEPETGFVMNLTELKAIMKEHVIEPLDHLNLNVDVPFMAGKLTSTENLAMAIWQILDPIIRERGCQMFRIRLSETENNAVEYYGQED